MNLIEQIKVNDISIDGYQGTYYDDNLEYVQVTTDADGKILEGIKSDGTKHIGGDLIVDGSIYNESLDIEQIVEDIQERVDEILESAEETLSYFETVENPEYAEVSKDKNDRIYEGLTKAGVKMFEVPVKMKQLDTEGLNVPSDWIDGQLIGRIPDDAYAVKDNIKRRLIVDCFGNGDYTTIKNACAAVENPSYTNQYEICVYPGTYNECFIQIPAYTHIHGIAPNTVIVTSKGYPDDSGPVFQYEHFSSKLSNMTIESYVGYCIHDDTSLVGCANVSENLHLKKMRAVNNEWSIIGGAAFRDGFLSIFNNCVFESFDSRGSVAFHTRINEIYENSRIILRNCKFINSYVRVGTVGGFGNVSFTLENCTFQRGARLATWSSNRKDIDAPSTYLANKCQWQILGRNNKNLAIDMENDGEGLQVISDNYVTDEVITIEGTAVDAIFGALTSQKGGPRIKAYVRGVYRVMDEQTVGDTPKDIFQMWKRLGDCSVTPKTLSVSINGGTAMTYTFNQNYLSTKPSEADIIADVNTALSGCSLTKYTPSTWDNVNLIEKQFVTCRASNGILKGEWVRISGTRCDSFATKEEVLGVAVSDANNGESLQVWTGDAIKVNNLPNGDYGIDDNGQLVINASIIIGKVISNILYKL